jgi:hypothetical protein
MNRFKFHLTCFVIFIFSPGSYLVIENIHHFVNFSHFSILEGKTQHHHHNHKEGHSHDSEEYRSSSTPILIFFDKIQIVPGKTCSPYKNKFFPHKKRLYGFVNPLFKPPRV